MIRHIFGRKNCNHPSGRINIALDEVYGIYAWHKSSYQWGRSDKAGCIYADIAEPWANPISSSMSNNIWNESIESVGAKTTEGRSSVVGLRARFQFGAHVLFWRFPGAKKRLAHLVLHFLGGNRTWDHTTLKHFSVTSRAQCLFITP